MKNLRNKNAPPPETAIQTYLSTSWDKVLAVYNKLAEIELLADSIEAGALDDLLTPQDIDTIAELNAILTDATLGDFASQAEAEGGINNDKTMTPLRVAQAITTFIPSLQNDYAAVGMPGSNDDASQGWSAGSVWIDVSVFPNEAYRCSDPTIGLAVWLKTTLTADELAQIALTGNSDDLIEGVTKLLLTVAERAKLAGIEAGAEVTSTAKVAAVGAVMDTDFPAEGLMRATTGGGAYTVLKTNLNAAVDPTSNDDSGDGYGIGSPWFNTTASPRKYFVCMNASVGAAVWLQVGDATAGLQARYKSVNYTALSRDIVYVDTGAGAITITLPASPVDNDSVAILDAEANANINNITVARNGSTINGVAADFIIDLNNGRVDFVYSAAHATWEYQVTLSTGQLLASDVVDIILNDTLTGLPPFGSRLFLPASSLYDGTTPADFGAFTRVESAATGAMYGYRTASGTVNQEGQFTLNLSERYNVATHGFKLQVQWVPTTAGAGNVKFEISAIGYNDGNELTADFVVGGTVVDACQLSTTKMHSSPLSAAFTFTDAQLPTPGISHWRLRRLATDAEDTYGSDIRIIAFSLYASPRAFNDNNGNDF